jgi:3-methylcrotonyl-CoA carboxylase alpha subunit
MEFLKTPATSPTANIRVESGVVQGDEVSIFYDPMIAKLVVWDSHRDKALKKMEAALKQYQIVGLPTNIEFLQKAVVHPEFFKGEVDTGFIARHKDELIPELPKKPSSRCVGSACIALLSKELEYFEKFSDNSYDPHSPWNSPSNFRLNSFNSREVVFKYGENAFTALLVYKDSDGEYLLKLQDSDDWIPFSGSWDSESGEVKLTFGSEMIQTTAVFGVEDQSVLHVFEDGVKYTLRIQDRTSDSSSLTSTSSSKDALLAPMPGKVVKVSVKSGSKVKKGAPLIIMEAMKMEHVIKAPHDGEIENVYYQEGDFVPGGKLLLAFKQN